MSTIGLGMISLVMLMGGGGGLPLGLPPLPPDPKISRVAPDDCLFYLSWAGTATPDPASDNQAEQLLAEPEIRYFVAELERRIVESIQREAGGDPESAQLIEDAKTVILTILTRPTAIFVSDVKITLQGPTVQAGAVVSLGDRADEVKKLLEKFQTMVFGPEVRQNEGRGATWYSLPMPPDAPPIEWNVVSGYLVIGAGAGAADAILKRGTTEVPEWLAAIDRQLPVGRRSSVMYVNTGRIIRTYAPLGGPEVMGILKALGVDRVESITSAFGFGETDCVSKCLIAVDGELTGVLSPFAGKPLTKDDLTVIPADATLALAVQFDLAKAFEEFAKVVGEIEPRAREEMTREMSQAERALGFRFQEDLFQSLGDTWRVYNAPSEGGLIFTGLTGVVDVRDRDQLTTVNERIIRLIGQEMKLPDDVPSYRRRGATVEKFSYLGETVYFLNVIGEGFPLAPAWCITDDTLIVATFPQNVKAYLSRRAASNSGESLVDVPEVGALFAGSEQPLVVAYADTPKLFRMAYPLVQMALQVGCSELQREGFDVDISILPSAGAITPHLRPSVCSVTRTAEGVLIESHSTIPLGGTGAGMMTLALPAMLFNVRSSARMEAEFEKKVMSEEMMRERMLRGEKEFPRESRKIDEMEAVPVESTRPPDRVKERPEPTQPRIRFEPAREPELRIERPTRPAESR